MTALDANKGNRVPDECDVVVIGSGLGSLICALELARQGQSVTLFEKNRSVGGMVHAFRRQGYHFDVSLHFLGGLKPGCLTHGILTSLGVLQRLSINRNKYLCKIVVPGYDLLIPNQVDLAIAELTKHFPEERDGLERLFTQIKELKADVIAPWVNPEYEPNPQRMAAKYMDNTFDDILCDFIKNEALKNILSQMWLYVGLPPSKGTANFSSCIFSSAWIEGSYQIVGGGATLVRVLVERLREEGGDCFTGHGVEEIVVENGKARGIRLENGEFVKARTVVSGVDPYQTFNKLIANDKLSKIFKYRLSQMQSSLSMFATYIGLDCPASELGVVPGNSVYSYDGDCTDSYERISNTDYDKTPWYVTSNEGFDDRLLPKGCGIISIMEPAISSDWHLLSGPEYEKRKAALKEQLLAKYSKKIKGLKDHINICIFGTPKTIAEFSHCHLGAVYGFAQTIGQSNSRRLRNRTPIDGLFLTGAWTWSGGGYEGAMMTGIQTAQAVMSQLGARYKAPQITLYHEEENVEVNASQTRESRPDTLVVTPIDPKDEREYYKHVLPISVYGDDLNSRGHVDLSSYMRYIDRGRVEAIEYLCNKLNEESWLKKYTINVYRIDMKSATVGSLSDKLEVRTGLRRTTSHRAAFDQRIVNIQTGGLMVDAVVEVLFLDMEGKLVPTPNAITTCKHNIANLTRDKVEPVPFKAEEVFPFRTPFRVYYEDTDTQQITYHVSYSRFCERALLDLVRTVWTEMNATQWVAKYRVYISRMDIRYLNASVLGDWLEVRTGILKISTNTITFGQRIVLRGTDRVMADATTEVEFRDENERTVPLPKQILEISYENFRPSK